MKCWDSSTSAMAAVTSDLMAPYCALRSSNGTFIFRFLLHLPVRLGADPELGRQRSLFIQIQAPQYAALHFLVAVAGFRTPHHAVFIGRFQPVSVPAHPS